MPEPVNSVTYTTGYPPGTVRFESVEVKGPSWWRRVWDWLRGRRSAYTVHYRFTHLGVFRGDVPDA